jgi:hypothetical protein
MTFGIKDSLGNILNMDGAVFINDLGEGIAIEIDENGYPVRLVDSDGNKMTFTNYTSSTVDISIYDFDEYLIAGPITIEIDPDLLDELFQLYNTTKGIRELTRDGHDTAKFLKAGSVALKLAGCTASAIGAAGTGGIAIPLAVICCGSAFVSLVEAVEPEILPVTPVNSASTGVITNGLDLIFKDKFSPWGVGGWLLGNTSNMVEFAATKEDIDEIHTQFIQALENQDWEGARKCCILDSEAYNMVLGAEIAFANECLSQDNTNVDVVFTDTSGWFIERPTASVNHDNVVITIIVEGYGSDTFSGEWVTSEFEELYENKWRLTKSGILNLTGVTQGPLPVPTLYDPGETIGNDLEYTLSWSDENQHDGVVRYYVIEDTNPQYNINSPDYKGYVVEGNSFKLSHNVTEDTTYYYEVRSCAGCQGCAINSKPSNQVNITILEEFIPENRVYNITQNIYYNTIQAALDDVNSGDTIELSDGTYNELITFPEDKEMTLQSVNGPESTIIDGSGLNGTVVKITYNQNGVTLKDLTITGGNSSDDTGGIKVFDSTLYLNNCIIHDNSGQRGVIGNFINSVTSINDCIISNNYSDWLVTICNATDSQLTISNSTISQNIGAAIRNMTGASIDITGCEIKNNAGDIYGGLKIDDDSGTVNIGGSDANDISDFNTICGNETNGIATIDNQIISSNSYPYNNISATCEVTGTYELRDIGPAGGYIFYDKGYYSDGWRYLEAAPASTEWTNIKWSNSLTFIGGTLSDIGTGKANTGTIVLWLNSLSEVGTAA